MTAEVSAVTLRVVPPQIAPRDASRRRSKVDSPEALARMLIRRYKRRGLRRLLDAFSRGVPLADIAPAFGADPRRVAEWRLVLGSSVSIYAIHPDIMAISREEEG